MVAHNFDDVHGGKKGLKDFQCLFQVIGGEKELCANATINLCDGAKGVF